MFFSTKVFLLIYHHARHIHIFSLYSCARLSTCACFTFRSHAEGRESIPENSRLRDSSLRSWQPPHIRREHGTRLDRVIMAYDTQSGRRACAFPIKMPQRSCHRYGDPKLQHHCHCLIHEYLLSLPGRHRQSIRIVPGRPSQAILGVIVRG